MSRPLLSGCQVLIVSVKAHGLNHQLLAIVNDRVLELLVLGQIAQPGSEGGIAEERLHDATIEVPGLQGLASLVKAVLEASIVLERLDGHLADRLQADQGHKWRVDYIRLQGR